MKEWTSTIVIRIYDVGREASTEEAYRQLVKDQFSDDYNFVLKDDEIQDVNYFEDEGAEWP